MTREENLQDVVAAYDLLAAQPGVDRGRIAVVGSSYGGYLAAILTSMRAVQWLALRVPALYVDSGWEVPKLQLRKEQNLDAWRQTVVRAQENRALHACSDFRGDVLLVQSETDHLIPPAVISNYREACVNARSLTYRVMKGADHGLTDERMRQAYTAILFNWLREEGLAGSTIMDIGCGSGELLVRALEAGATRGTGADLSSEAIAMASDLAHETGFHDRLDLWVGDAAVESLDPHDVVVLDKVICCYPDADALIARSTGAARHLYAFAVPESRGFWGLIARMRWTFFALLEILKRRGKYQPEDFARLRLTRSVDLHELKASWLTALAEADTFVRSRPPAEVGCLYYSPHLHRFVAPGADETKDAVPHYGRPGGVLPRILESSN